MEVAEPPRQATEAALSLRLFGPLKVTRGGQALDLPPSRKVRALLGYLAVAPHPVGRNRLADLLGDLPNDPRGEVRWCLSKLRALVDEPGQRRLRSQENLVWLDLSDCSVDALRIDRSLGPGFLELDSDHLRDLCDLLVGDFLEGLDLGRSPQLDHWLAVQRRRYRNCQERLLQRLIELFSEDPVALRPYAERWAELSPLEADAQLLLLQTLLACERLHEAEQHFEAAARLFQAEDLDADLLRRKWRELKRRATQAVRATGEMNGTAEDGAESEAEGEEPAPEAARRASLAIMPFAESTPQAPDSRLAEGLTHDIIQRLARLRNMFVIARGSVFGLAEAGLSPREAARRLKVDYFASGILRRAAGRLQVAVELAETQSGRILWSEDFDLKQEQAFLLLEDIGDRIVAAISSEIEAAERNRAILKPPSSLTAWEAYHCGLWHMYRFTRPDNERAQDFSTRRARRIQPLHVPSPVCRLPTGRMPSSIGPIAPARAGWHSRPQGAA